MEQATTPAHTGRKLFASTRDFATEDRAQTWRLLTTTVMVWACGLAIAASRLPLPVRIAASVVEGLTVLRLFIFLHDIEHKAIFRASRVGPIVSRVIGLLTLVSPKVWRDFHNAHHGSAGLLLDADLSKYRGGDRINRVVDLDAYAELTPPHRLGYKIARHALIFPTAWLTVFAIGIGLGPVMRDPRRNADSLVVLFLHFAIVAALWAIFGAGVAVLTFILPSAIASTVGAYLFFAQHNFPGSEFQPREQRWDMEHAALRNSSFFRMSPLMHWFTGNIGYHHIHHLNPRIPFYRLPDAMAAIPELQHPIETSFAPRDIAACLSLHVWNPGAGKLMSYEEADALVEAREQLDAAAHGVEGPRTA